MNGDWQALAHAETLLDLRRDADAERAFRDVLASAPDSVPALVGLARALNRRDDPAGAERAVRRAIALEPESVSAYEVLVDILVARRDGPAALTAAEAGLRLAPHEFSVHYQYARALLAQRRPRVRDAYGAALRAVDLAPHSPDAHNLVGLCLDALGDRENSQRAFRTAMQLDPQHATAQNNLASSEMDRGRLRSAAGLLRSAAGANPQEKRIHRNLDAVLLLLGRRILWSLVAVAIVLGVLIAQEAPWWTRALSGAAYIVLLTWLLRGVRAQLPSGVTYWARGLWGRTRWLGRYLIAMLVLFTAGVLLLAFAPYRVAAGAGLTLLVVLRILAPIVVLSWIVTAVINLVRGR